MRRPSVIVIPFLALVGPASAEAELRCGPVGRGRPARDGTRCECVAPAYVEEVRDGTHRCVARPPEPHPRPVAAPERRAEPRCAAEEHASAGRCCPAGHEWVPALGRCTCVEPSRCGSAPRPAPAPDGYPQPPSIDNSSDRTVPYGYPQPGSVDDLLNRAAQPERPSRSDVTGVLSSLNGPVRACLNGETGTAPVSITILSSGAVSSARVTGQFAETPAGRCIEAVVSRARFRSFRAAQVSITYPYVVRAPQE